MAKGRKSRSTNKRSAATDENPLPEKKNTTIYSTPMQIPKGSGLNESLKGQLKGDVSRDKDGRIIKLPEYKGREYTDELPNFLKNKPVSVKRPVIFDYENEQTGERMWLPCKNEGEALAYAVQNLHNVFPHGIFEAVVDVNGVYHKGKGLYSRKDIVRLHRQAAEAISKYIDRPKIKIRSEDYDNPEPDS